MGVRPIDISTAVVEPGQLAGFRFQAVDKDTLEGPDPGGEVDLSILEDRSAPDRPRGDQASVSKQAPAGWSSPELPLELSAVCAQAVEMAVIRAEIDALPRGYRGEANGPIGVEAPCQLSIIEVQRGSPPR